MNNLEIREKSRELIDQRLIELEVKMELALKRLRQFVDLWQQQVRQEIEVERNRR